MSPLRTATVVLLVVLTAVATDRRCHGQESGATADSKAVVRVLAAQVRALLQLPFNPDEAYDYTKGVRESIRDDADLTESARKQLVTHLEWTLRIIATSGVYFKQQQAERRQLWATYRLRLDILKSDLQSLLRIE